MLLETKEDLQFAENVEEIALKMNKLIEACEAAADENRQLSAKISVLTEAFAEQTEMISKILRAYGNIPATNNLTPDVVLM
jgi:hypothetical protein